MESTYLKTLIEVAKKGSISRAADALCVTQPAVSRRIKFIEEQYGYLLLDRSGQTLVLTDAGKMVFEKAELMLSIERELLSELKAIDHKENINFICTPTFGIAHLPAIMRDFMIKYKDQANLSFMFDMPRNIVEKLRNGMYDMAVVDHCECFDFSELSTVALIGDDLIIVSAPSIGLSGGNISLEELLSQAMFICKEGSCPKILLEKNLSAAGKTLSDFSSCVIIDDLHMIIESVVSGQGISLLSRELVLDHIESGLLLEHSVSGFRHQRNRTLVINSGCRLLPKSPLDYFMRKIYARCRLL